MRKQSEKIIEIAAILEANGETVLASHYRNAARIETEREDFAAFDRPVFDEIRRRAELQNQV